MSEGVSIDDFPLQSSKEITEEGAEVRLLVLDSFTISSPGHIDHHPCVTGDARMSTMGRGHVPLPRLARSGGAR